jgi:hypothetical protein
MEIQLRPFSPIGGTIIKGLPLKLLTIITEMSENTVATGSQNMSRPFPA